MRRDGIAMSVEFERDEMPMHRLAGHIARISSVQPNFGLVLTKPVFKFERLQCDATCCLSTRFSTSFERYTYFDSSTFTLGGTQLTSSFAMLPSHDMVLQDNRRSLRLLEVVLQACHSGCYDCA